MKKKIAFIDILCFMVPTIAFVSLLLYAGGLIIGSMMMPSLQEMKDSPFNVPGYSTGKVVSINGNEVTIRIISNVAFRGKVYTDVTLIATMSNGPFEYIPDNKEGKPLKPGQVVDITTGRRRRSNFRWSKDLTHLEYKDPYLHIIEHYRGSLD